MASTTWIFPPPVPIRWPAAGPRSRSAAATISSEVVWNDGASGGATGGGVSETFPLPSYQSKAKVPTSANKGKFKGRGVPDISGDADPATGYQVTSDGSSFAVGGTSAVAPLWAGLVALLNQGLGKPVGYLNTESVPDGGHQEGQLSRHHVGQQRPLQSGSRMGPVYRLGQSDGHGNSNRAEAAVQEEVIEPASE